MYRLKGDRSDNWTRTRPTVGPVPVLNPDSDYTNLKQTKEDAETLRSAGAPRTAHGRISKEEVVARVKAYLKGT